MVATGTPLRLLSSAIRIQNVPFRIPRHGGPAIRNCFLAVLAAAKFD
jgi:hypothetical protein